jgi:hypothetical protein
VSVVRAVLELALQTGLDRSGQTARAGRFGTDANRFIGIPAEPGWKGEYMKVGFVVVDGDQERVNRTTHVKHTVLLNGRDKHHIYSVRPDRTLHYVQSFDSLDELTAAGFAGIPAIRITVVEIPE